MDTSGLVTIPLGTPQAGDHRAFWAWSDLSPFAQGYVEALFATFAYDATKVWQAPHRAPEQPSFSDLHPEALALILRDCEAFQERADRAGWGFGRESDGRFFWQFRQRGDGRPDFPPLVPYLNDAGQVCLREAS